MGATDAVVLATADLLLPATTPQGAVASSSKYQGVLIRQSRIVEVIAPVPQVVPPTVIEVLAGDQWFPGFGEPLRRIAIPTHRAS